MTTHVFIVDLNTFKYHLEFLFAGTGAKDHFYIDFNDNPNTGFKHGAENNLVGMIADFLRIRKGDFVIFYLQQNAEKKVYEGKFYGIFKVKSDISFLDNDGERQYLKDKLNKSLTFRTLIEPYQVYPKGVTEWEALDEIKHIPAPYQMLWSLIYRKLKGNRGNTMITIYESEKLFNLIKLKNNRQYLELNNFTFNIEKQEIEPIQMLNIYDGRMSKINILPRLLEKYKKGKAFESHLQAYILQNIGLISNRSLDESLLIEGYNIEWIGNEVSCGVGMQRIDVMLSLTKNDTARLVMPIELKAVEADENNIFQISRYIDWIEQYYIPNRISDIQPVLIAKTISDKNAETYKNIINIFSKFNKNNIRRILPLLYIEYEVENNNLIFKKVNYR